MGLPKQVNLNRYKQLYLGSQIVRLEHHIAELKRVGTHESEYLYLEVQLKTMIFEKRERHLASKRKTWHKNKEKYKLLS